MAEWITLPNGVRVALEPMAGVRSITLGVWAGSGSRWESPAENGSSHFIEHMLFKGTRTRSARDIAEEMDAVGGQINAFTTKEYTCFHTRVLDTHFSKALDVLQDMYLHPRFDADDVEREKGVIADEIAMYEDDPEDLCLEGLEQGIWRGSGLGQPILGRTETVNGLSRQGLVAFCQGHYRPEDTVVAVAGSFKTEEMQARLAESFGSFVRTGSRREQAPAAYVQSRRLVQREIEQLHLCLGFPGLPRDHRLKYALSVFNTLFGGGMSSRLFQNIREACGLTYTISSYTTAFPDTGLFAVYAAMSPAQAERVKDLVLAEMEKIRAEGVSQALLQKTKDQLASSFLLGAESTANRMSALGSSLLVRGRIQDSEQVLRELEAVTRADVEQVMELLLRPEEMSISAVGNESALAACGRF